MLISIQKNIQYPLALSAMFKPLARKVTLEYPFFFFPRHKVHPPINDIENRYQNNIIEIICQEKSAYKQAEILSRFFLILRRSSL
jgi:hypothetical protein